jgi:hypothetical protein
LRRFHAFTALLAVLVTGCDDAPKEIEDVRERAATTSFQSVPTAERFGFNRSDPHGAAAEARAPQLEWTTPEGWKDAPPSQMRAADFRIARDPEAECYLSILPGGAGGVLANVNRWRKQMGLEEIQPGDLDQLPRETLLGKPAILVDLEGVYAGMGEEGARAGYRMLGLVLEAPGSTIFLKMTGPAATVATERPRFLELAASLRPAVPRESATTGGWAWDVPSGWEPRPRQPMRVVTLAPANSPGTECYVTVLAGPAGGIEANINRWRQQMGQPPLGEAELSELPVVKMTTGEARLVEVRGHFTGMRGEKLPDAALLGAVCPLPDSVLFVKMTGPADVVARERENFISFCGSLRAQ